jgi:hypothetical protein
MKRLVIALVVLLIVLHQDFWWWDSVDPIFFGFMPIGLAWHVFISIAAAVVWLLAAKYCWPAGVDVADHQAAAPRQQRGEL